MYDPWVSNWRHQVFYGWSEAITSHDILTLHLNDSTEGRLKWLYVVGRVSERAVDDAQAEWIKFLPTSRVKSAVAVIAEDWGGCNNKVVDESIILFVRSDSDIVFPIASIFAKELIVQDLWDIYYYPAATQYIEQ